MDIKRAGEILYKHIDKIELAVVAIGILLLFNRVFYGVDLTDETWYVAEPYIVANGAIPYLNNWTQVPGFTLPLALAYKVFLYFNGSTEGIMLFSRLLYATWITLIMILSVYIIRRNSQNFLPYLVIVILVFCGNRIYDICYNTIGIVYTFLVFAIVFFAVPNSSKYGKVLLIVSGVIFARAIIGTPYLLFTWVFLTGWFLMQKQFKEYLLFFMGNVLATIMVIGWVCWQGSFNEFLSGMHVFLFNNAYLNLPQYHTYYGDFKSYLKFFAPALVIVVAFFMLKKLKITEKVSFVLYYDDKKFCDFNLKIVLLVFFIVLGYIFKSYGWFVRCVWAFPFLLLVQERREQMRSILRKICIFDVICVVFYISTVFNIYGYSNSKGNWLLVPVALSIACLFLVAPRTIVNRVLLFLCMFVWGIVNVRSNYLGVYSDMPIKQLDTMVQRGIWKGCYTTSERAQAVVELEKYIRSVTLSKDEVLFLDWVSFGYLMTDAKACTPSALEGAEYGYKSDNDGTLHNYFLMVKKIPSTIIYVDFHKWDETDNRFNKGLSIDNPSWKFNKFVNKHYDLQEVYHTKHNVVVQYEKDSKTPKDKKIIVKYYQLKKSANVPKILEDLKSEVL